MIGITPTSVRGARAARPHSFLARHRAARFFCASANATPLARVNEGVRSSWTGGCALATQTESDDLALAVHQRESGAFERLVETFEGRLYNYVERILQNRFDAQEVVQDTFMRAHEALTRQYDAARAEQLLLKPWLFRIARNLCFNKRRGLRSALERPLTEFDDGRIGPLVPSTSVSSPLESQQERAALERALDSLPAESRELIVLRFMEEMSYAEISKTTGHEENVLRGRVFRSLKLLRDALSRDAAPVKQKVSGRSTPARKVSHAM